MPQIIAFTSPKGGCGSTFVCALLCCMMSRQSQKVLAVDMCFERGTLDSALGFQDDYVYTLRDAAEGDCTLEEAICSFGGVSFLRCGYEFEYLDYDAIGELLKGSDYDFILMDMPSCYEEIKDGVLSFADMLVLVTDTSSISQKLCDRYIQGTDFENTLMIINKIIPSYIEMGIHMTVDEILDTVGIPLLGLVPWTPDADIVLSSGAVSGIDDNRLSEAFSNISLRLKGERIPALDIDRDYDCFKKSRTRFKNRI